MAYDRDFDSRGPRRRGGSIGRGEHGTDYEAPLFRGDYDMGYEGGALRSRGSWIEGARRAGQGAPYDDEFEWGGGYVGGRGYGGTNYDYEHGYQTNIAGRLPRGGALRPRGGEFSSPASRGGYAWGEEVSVADEYGPARYGYGPYFDRLRRRRRPDQELRQEVEDALFFDTWVDADAIEITVRDGVVTLSGTLPSYDEIRFAVDDAWDVDGVRGVRSEMEVEGEAERGREGAGMEEPPERAGARGETGRRGATGRGAGTARGRTSGGASGRAAGGASERAAAGGAQGRAGSGTRAASQAGRGSAQAGRGASRSGRQGAGRAGGTATRETGRAGARAGGGIESGRGAARSAGAIEGPGGTQAMTPTGTPPRSDTGDPQG